MTHGALTHFGRRFPSAGIITVNALIKSDTFISSLMSLNIEAFITSHIHLSLNHW